MDTLIQDVRVAIRALAARPSFVAVAVLTLALGIGATTALFSVVHGVLLRPLPYHDAGRIVALWQTARDNPAPSAGGSVAHVNYQDWKRDARSFESMALYTRANFTLTGLGEAEVVPGALVTTGFFEVFKAAPVLGRAFTADEDRPNGPPVVIVSHAFWRERLGGRADVIGSTLELSGGSREIVGVAPAGFAYPTDARIWGPVANDDNSCGRACVYLNGVARLAPGVTVEGARAEMQGISQRLERDFPEANTNIAVAVTRLQDQIVGDVRTPLLLLLGAVAMLMLIACANVANLLLVRGAARQGEIAVRAALGAGRGRLVRFLLTESAILAALGAAAGLLLAWWGVDALKLLAPPNVPRLEEVSIDGVTLAFALGTAAITALLFGLGPAVNVLRMPLTSLIGGRGQAGGRSRWSRSALLVGEVALSLTLLSGAGLLLRSMHQLQSIDPGWRSDGVTVFTLGLPSLRYPAAADVVRTFDQLDERLTAIPGVELVGRISGLPLGTSINVLDFRRPDRPEPPVGQVPTALYRVVDDDYFRALGIPVLAGRAFDARDAADGQPAIIISREMADEFWRGEDPLGKQVRIGSTDRTITGIVEGVRSTNVEQPPEPEMYVPHAQAAARSATFVLRSSQPPGQVLAAARDVVTSMDTRLPLIRPGSLAALEDTAMARPRFYLLLLGLFALLAVALAGVGIYGVVAYIVTQRRREIGVRVALGARSTDVLRLIVWQGLRPALAGVLLGLGGAAAAGQAMSTVLYQVHPRDLPTLAVVTVGILAIVVLACAVPAWRATQVPASTALRTD